MTVNGENDVCFTRQLPDVVVRKIFQILGARDSLAASQTCRHWRRIGIGTRSELRTLVVSDFYVDLLKYERYIEFPAFHRREDLAGLTLVRTKYVKNMVRWLCVLFPNVIHLAFRNFIRRVRDPPPGFRVHPCRFHIFVINEVMELVGNSWPKLEILDISGEIVEVRSLHHVKRWPNFKEIRLSGCDLSYNMLTTRYLVAEALTKTFWNCLLEKMRISNLDFIFDMTFTKMTMFKALNNKSLTTAWLNDFLKEAVNLKTLMIECQYLQDENVALMGDLVKLEDVMLRNCLYVTDFSPLGNLPKLRSIVLDCGGRGTETQLCQIVKGSKKWRRIILNEMGESIGNEFLRVCADQFSENSCFVMEFELNTEKTDFLHTHPDWVLPGVDVDGMKMLVAVCPYLETFGICASVIDDEFLLELAERCPRVRNVIVNDSNVTDWGVLRFYQALRARRAVAYGGAEFGGAFVDARRTLCTKHLEKKAAETFGNELKICR